MRRSASSGSPFEPTIGFSRALRVDRHVFVAGTAAVWPDGHVDPDAGVQAERCFEIIGQALADVGASLGDVVRTRIFLVDSADGDAVAAVHGRLFGEIRPASSFLVLAGLLDPRWKVEIEAEAIV
jgi:enamine deaminase RidA (YjgF/YER057c/UK114 family)